jgi:hypothetical protein
VRIEAEIIAILERAGLALVGVHRHQPRALLGAHELPLAAGRKARAAKPAKAGVADDLDELVAGAIAGERFFEQLVAALGRVRVEVGGGLERMRMRVGRRELFHRVVRRLRHLHMADRADRRAIARAHARRANHAHARAQEFRQIVEQTVSARHRARKRIAHSHRDRRRRRLALLHHVEMRVEGRDLVDLGLRKLHLGRKRREMRRGDVTVLVLNKMQMLDEEIAAARAVGEQGRNFRFCARIDLAALGRTARFLAAARRPGTIAIQTRRRALDVHCSSPAPDLNLSKLPNNPVRDMG